MRRTRLERCGVILGSSLLVSACGWGGSHEPVASQPAAPTVRALAGTGTLLLRTRIAGYQVQDVAGGGWVLGDIWTLDLTVKNAQDAVLASITLGRADIDDQVTFANLPVGEVLTVVCQARNAAGDVISRNDSGQSQVSVLVTESGVTSATLTVQLADMMQQTQNATFHGIGVNPGNLVSAGPITISTESAQVEPTPAPSLVLVDNDRLVIAAGTTPTFTLPAGTYVLAIGNIVPAGASATVTWTLYAADGTTVLGTYSGLYEPMGQVTIDTTGTGNVGTLTFTAANADPMTLTPRQDTLTITAQ